MVIRRWPGVVAASALLLSHNVQAQTPVTSGVDLSELGAVAVGGNFDAISTYSYEGQQEGIQGNGTQSVLTYMPNGMYATLARTDANIEDLCAFTTKNGTFLGVIVAGNFTSIGGQAAQSCAFIDPSGNISPHPGIQGVVNTVLCDADTETAYLGGTFDAADSSNAIAWLAAGSWANLPFAGFDAPVTTISKAPDGHIIFGGSFNGLKNGTTTIAQDGAQLINLAAASITSVNNVTSGQGIACPSNDSASTWELKDDTAGSWTASLRYGFEPAKLRLYNNLQGNGVETWRFTALPNTGIMNFTYTDPTTGQKEYCDARCPLAQNSSLEYQDFYFVNTIGMNSFRLDVSGWYGQGGALRGIELYQNDTFVYAISSTDGPSCLSATSTLSSVTTTGAWSQTPSRSSYADYLTAVVGPTTLDNTNIIFRPDIDGKGNYTVVMYTPGCIQDSSCSARGFVNVTGTMVSGQPPFSTLISQTNDYEKYDQIYQGPVDGVTGSFQPSITLTPSGQRDAQLIVASRIRFSGNPSTGGLNGLFEYNPNVAVVDMDFSKSAINNVGTRLKGQAIIEAMAVHDEVIYTGGSFSDDDFENIMSFSNNNAQSLSNGGLNAAVAALYASSDLLYVGGNFTAANQNGPSGLSNVAAYNYAQSSWVALGAGLDGPVNDIVPFQLNVTSGQNETVIGVSGDFENILASGSNPSHSVSGFAVWVPSQSTWLQNVASYNQFLAGMLSSYTTLPNSTWIGAGTLITLGEALNGAAGLTPQAQIKRLPINIQPSQSSSQSTLGKRALLTEANLTGVVTGAYDRNGDTTFLAGHFTASVNNTNIENLAMIDNSNNATTGLPTGIDNNSTFLSLLIQDETLFAGGLVTGNVNNTRVQGLILYDMSAQNFRSPQPAALDGDEVIVNSFANQPDTKTVYVGGSFDATAQGLACSSVCAYDLDSSTWAAAGAGLSGVVTALYFTDDTHMIAAGNLSVSGNSTMLAEYDTKAQAWSVYNTATLPGPITSMSSTGDATTFWAAGTVTSNNSAYLVKITQGSQAPVTGLFEMSTSILGIELVPSKNHGSTRYLDSNQDLMVMGSLNITGYGQASAALFNGTTMQPFLLSVNSEGESASVRSVFYQKRNPAKNSRSYGHSNGIAILVAFCAALGTIFLIVLAGMLLNRIQRKRAGYNSVPHGYQDKNMNINRVPPERLFASMGQRTPGAPVV